MAALEKVGISAFYVPLNDIATEHGKIGGAAQKRLANGGMLHHVTMSYDIDADKMVEVLRIGKEKLSDKGTRSAKKRVDPLRRQTGLARAEIVAAMMDVFAERYGATPSVLTDAELEAAAPPRGDQVRHRGVAAPGALSSLQCSPPAAPSLPAQGTCGEGQVTDRRRSVPSTVQRACAVRARCRWLRCSMMIRRSARGASGCAASQWSVRTITAWVSGVPPWPSGPGPRGRSRGQSGWRSRCSGPPRRPPGTRSTGR